MKTFFKLLSAVILITPVIAAAQYQPLVGIPGVSTGGDLNFDQYLQAVYATAISLAALLAVIKIVIAGVKWMTTDIVSSKSDAKKDIQGAILGLVVILAAVLILYIINPNIGAVSLELTAPPRSAPAPVAVPSDTIQSRIDSCQESSTCVVSTCEQTSDGVSATYNCTEQTNECRNNLNGVAQQISENTVLCIRAGQGSVVEEETDNAQDAIRNFFNENGDEYLSIVAIYTVNQRDYRENRDLSPTEMAENIDLWADECEVDSTGDLNDNEFIELEDVQRGVYVRFCAQRSSN